MCILNKNKKQAGFLFVLLFILSSLYSCKGLTQEAASVSSVEPEKTYLESDSNQELKGGWYGLDPFQYEKEENGLKIRTGLDYELMKVLSKDVGVKISYENIFWEELLQAIKMGKIDFATGAIYSAERATYAYYSIPVRYEEDSFFVLQKNLKYVKGKSIAQLLNYLKENKLKLGVVNGVMIADATINEYINDPLNANLIVKYNNDYEDLEHLLNQDIFGFLTDRIVGSTVIWRMGVGKQVSEYRLNIMRPIHIIFSKKSVSPDIVKKYNEVIEKIEDNEAYQKIVSWYLYPVLFLQTEDSGWFRLTEVIGTVAFAISGLIIAFKERATLFGAFILATLPSLGGSLMRDVIFGRNPVGILQSPVYLSCVLLTVLVGFLVIKLLKHLRRRYEVPGEIEDLMRRQAGHILIVTDAIGLAMFTVTGVIVSLLAKADPLWLWGPFFAFLTGAGGGILRDMLSKARYIAALEGELYGEIAIVWGLFLSLFIMSSVKESQPEYIQGAVIVTIVGVFLTRLLVHFRCIPNARFER